MVGVGAARSYLYPPLTLRQSVGAGRAYSLLESALGVGRLWGMESDELTFFNPWAGIERTGHLLPHWQQPGATYFITFRLGDSVPASIRREWNREREAWLAYHPKPWELEVEKEYHERFSRRMEAWLDAGHGCCLLRDVRVRGVVEEGLRHFDGERYVHHAWVIMPNHVHALVSLRGEWRLEQVLHTWKSYTTHAINRELRRSGTLWKEDYFDRLIRDEVHFANCVRYIRRNPEKAKLGPGVWGHYETEVARRWL